MARETNPPIVPPRSEKPRPPPPLSPSSPPTALSLAPPPRPSRSLNSPSSIYSQQASVAASPIPEDSQTKEISTLPARKHTVKFRDGKVDRTEISALETMPRPVDRGMKNRLRQEHDQQQSTVEEQTQKLARKSHLSHGKPRASSEEGKKKKEAEHVHLPDKPKMEPRQQIDRQLSQDIDCPVREPRVLLQTHGGARLVQQRQDIYRTHTRSAEARALYAEARDHYGKAKNHLQEAFRLSVDVLRLTPHVFIENVTAGEVGSGGRVGSSAGGGPRYTPEYPGIGVQYRSLFAPLLAGVGHEEKDRKQALEKKKREDALVRERAAVASHAAATSVTESARSTRSTTTGLSNSKPEASTAAVPPFAASRAMGQGDRPRRRKRPVAATTGGPPSLSTRAAASRPAVRKRDGSERRARTRSAAGRRMQRKKKDEEEVDHGILWFFSY